MSANVARHERGLTNLQNRLLMYGVRTKRMPQTNCPYDLETERGQRIEFKIGRLRKTNPRAQPAFVFNLHRHNVPFDSSLCDAVVFHCERGNVIVAGAQELEGRRHAIIHNHWRGSRGRKSLPITDLGIGAIVLAEMMK